jgi:hypothetical protein
MSAPQENLRHCAPRDAPNDVRNGSTERGELKMNVKFAEVVEKIRGLDTEGKKHLLELLKKLLIDERRKEIKRHAEESVKEYKQGKVRWGSVKQTKTSLYED